MRKTSNLKGSVRECSGFLVLAVLLGSLIWLGHSKASNSPASLPNEPFGFAQKPKREPKTRPSPNCPQCAPAGHQEIYIPLIDLPEAERGEIVFNSRSPQAMDVTPTFYSRDGAVVIGDPVKVGSEEIRYLDIKQLLPERCRGERRWGGFSLSYDGFNREMWSQFRFLRVNGGGNVDEFFTVKDESRSDELVAAWWMPEKSEAIIALGNITDAATTAIVTFGDDRDRSVRLAPHATEILRFKSEKGERAESAAISVTGPAGSIVPTGLINK